MTIYPDPQNYGAAVIKSTKRPETEAITYNYDGGVIKQAQRQKPCREHRPHIPPKPQEGE